METKETREIHAKGYTKVEPIGASMEDSTTEKFVAFRKETKSTLDKITSDIHSLQIVVGKIKSILKQNVDIDPVNIKEDIKED